MKNKKGSKNKRKERRVACEEGRLEGVGRKQGTNKGNQEEERKGVRKGGKE